MRTKLPFIAVLFAASVCGFADTPGFARTPASGALPRTSLRVTSTAFADNQAIPAAYTCDGAQTPPPLAWSTLPRRTKSVAIFVEDLDAQNGPFTHWLVTGIVPTSKGLLEGGSMPQGAVAATNGMGDTGYAGPCPPVGRHRYHFHVYALDTKIAPPAGKNDFLSVIEGHVLAEGELVGTYERVQPPWMPLLRRIVEAFDSFTGAPA